MVPDFLFHLLIILKSDDIKYCTGVLVFLYFVHTKEKCERKKTNEKTKDKNVMSAARTAAGAAVRTTAGGSTIRRGKAGPGRCSPNPE